MLWLLTETNVFLLLIVDAILFIYAGETRKKPCKGEETREKAENEDYMLDSVGGNDPLVGTRYPNSPIHPHHHTLAHFPSRKSPTI